MAGRWCITGLCVWPIRHRCKDKCKGVWEEYVNVNEEYGGKEAQATTCCSDKLRDKRVIIVVGAMGAIGSLRER